MAQAGPCVGEREIEIGYAHTFELGGKRARRIEVGRVGVEIAEFQVADRERLLIADLKVRYAEALAAARLLAMLAELSELTTRTYRVAQHPDCDERRWNSGGLTMLNAGHYRLSRFTI